jgi:hypothetical protein
MLGATEIEARLQLLVKILRHGIDKQSRSLPLSKSVGLPCSQTIDAMPLEAAGGNPDPIHISFYRTPKVFCVVSCIVTMISPQWNQLVH